MPSDQRADPPSRRADLLQEIAQQEAGLARLEADRANARRRLDALQAELAALGAQTEVSVRLPDAVDARIPKTSPEKVKLFRSLFRGRQDVFPTVKGTPGCRGRLAPSPFHEKAPEPYGNVDAAACVSISALWRSCTSAASSGLGESVVSSVERLRP
jgi:hypothetical protein